MAEPEFKPSGSAPESLPLTLTFPWKTTAAAGRPPSPCLSAGSEVPLRSSFEHALPLLKAFWKVPSTLGKSWLLDVA